MHRNSNQYLAGHTPELAFQQRRNKRVNALWIALAVGAATTQAWASTPGETLISPSAYSAPIANNERQLLWGDTHLHSNVSADAFTLGSRLGPDQAYRFAMGLPVTNELGQTARLRAPLDFLAVTDHAEYHGVFPLLEERDAQLDGWPLGQQMADLLQADKNIELAKLFSDAIQSTDPALRTPGALVQSAWHASIDAAEAAYTPGVFTTLIGYEWTSMVTGDNLHRVVLFREGSEHTRKVIPFSAQDSTDPEALWSALSDYEAATGGRVMAIPHNGNLSNGRMFAPTRNNGDAIDADYAKRRRYWEPLYEMTQVKGDSETHPALSPEDSFADFETWDDGNITLTTAKEPEMLPYEYARSALGLGLAHREQLSVNPFDFGMIGSSDIHTALATTEEDNYFGKFLHDGPAPGRTELKMAGQLQQIWRMVSSGLAGVWSTQNTREAIFDAMQRKEVFATTGSRIRVRFFAGWNFDDGTLQDSQWTQKGYAQGVPMGGQLPATSDADLAPTLMIKAQKDPNAAHLDRIQVIKGWLDAEGKHHERIYDVVASGKRVRNSSNGLFEPVKDTTNLATATYSNAEGAAQLEGIWRDPDFELNQAAFYYVRVLEIPTPRWTSFDAVRFQEDRAAGDDGKLQERAYTSAVWYYPEG
jgi:hypothetical protein